VKIVDDELETISDPDVVAVIRRLHAASRLKHGNVICNAKQEYSRRRRAWLLDA
jgi:hypothetical protein